MTYDDIRKMKRRAYVNHAENWTKVILGDDEYQIVMNGKGGIESKKAIAQAGYSLNDIKPAVICGTVLEIRSELNRLSEALVAIYDGAEKRKGTFNMYDQDVRLKTDKIAYEITNILNQGIIKGA